MDEEEDRRILARLYDYINRAIEDRAQVGGSQIFTRHDLRLLARSYVCWRWTLTDKGYEGILNTLTGHGGSHGDD